MVKNDDFAVVRIVIEKAVVEVVGGVAMLSIANVKVVPAGTKAPKNPLQKKIVLLEVNTAPVLTKAVLVSAFMVKVPLEEGVYPLKVS